MLDMLYKCLLPNGNFEKGPKPSELKGTKVMNRNAIPNWEISGFVEYIKSGQKQGDMVLVVPEGNFAVRLGNDALVKQKVKVVKGMNYSITLSAARTSNLMKNGNFEEGPYIFPSSSWGVLVPPHIEDDHSPIPGWIVESLKAVKYIDAGHFSLLKPNHAATHQDDATQMIDTNK
ncbi:hypothetical protein SLEP1_g43867 [Rubroshorea leprosula]|uniref:DUF642 domain-containing protein n=1 Tax=Rubroshorea leprosula TaxID=152421 RepID=A0AAV5LFE6_9ROSI|nr:hypothetical protein SLEP1_g43867 [Rubroshorea leprosula]